MLGYIISWFTMYEHNGVWALQSLDHSCSYEIITQLF